EMGAVAQPLAIAWHAAKRAELGCNVLVMGAGLVSRSGCSSRPTHGLTCSRSDRAHDRSQHQVLGREFGATVLDVRAPGFDLAVTKAATAAYGADVVFDCVGTQASLAAVRRRGNIMNLAAWKVKPVVDMLKLVLSEVSIISACGLLLGMCGVTADDEFRFVGLEDIITRRIGLEEPVEKGIKGYIHEKNEMSTWLTHRLA
ncbi:uncharacterized protein BXZ73DRAFT_50231, partial [Epithele typhae]|uniref:uncharacterized protein n=1 Tax=Epithele typhae TaxID=378194 RepID=UPI0020084D47